MSTADNDELNENGGIEVPPVDEEMDELSGVSPFSRLITNLYSELKLIDPFERRSFAMSLDKPSENPVAKKINDFLDAVISSKIGSLVTLLIMKIFKRWYLQIDFVSEMDKAKYDMKKAMLDEIRDEMAA